MNVVIYARYSSHNQNEQSIEGQIQVCMEFAERNGYNVIGLYKDEAKSGTSDNRPQFQKMIADSASGAFEGILVYQLDRFARNRYDSATNKAKLKKNGVKVLSARENISDDASGILMESVLEGMAEYYSQELSQKVKRGMSINAEKFFYNGGNIPFGLTLKDVPIPIGANGKMVVKKQFDIDPVKAPIVQKIFDMYVQGHTMADIIRYLNERNIKTSFGKPFNKNSIRAIILNKKYTGVYSYNGKETPNIIPRIVTDEVFYAAQEKLLKNKEAPARARAKTEYLLTTKLFCGACQEMMIGVSGTSQSGSLYTYYGCKGNQHHKCTRKNISRDYIENLVINKAKELLTSENINAIAHAVYKTVCQTQDNTRLKQLQRDFINLEKQKANLFASLKICNIDSVKKSIFEEIANVEKQKLDIDAQIKLEEHSIVHITEKEIKAFLRSLKTNDYTDIKYKRMLINVLINRVYWYEKNIIIVFNIQNNSGDMVKANIPTISEIEKSLKRTEICSFKGSMAGVLRLELRLVVLETIVLTIDTIPLCFFNQHLC